MEAIQAVVALAAVAEEQWGLVTTAQARKRGISPQTLARLSNLGRLERLSHGVYRMPGTPPGPLDDIRAAWLALDPEAVAARRKSHDTVGVVSHRTAAAVHQLGDLDADKIEITTRRRRQTRRHDLKIHVRPIEPTDWELVDGLPVTTLVRTITDLAQESLDGGHLAGVVRDAVVDHHLDVLELAAALGPVAHRYGVAAGHGDVLVARLLQEAGIPDATKRAVSAVEDPNVAAAFSAIARLVVDQDMKAGAQRMSKAATLVDPAFMASITEVFSRLASDPELASTVDRAFKAPGGIRPFTQESVASTTDGRDLIRRLHAITAAGRKRPDEPDHDDTADEPAPERRTE